MPRYIEAHQTDIKQLPEVAVYQPKQAVWVLRSLGAGAKRKVYRYRGIVDRPLYSKVLVRWIDHAGVLHVDRLPASRLEKRDSNG